MRKREREDLAKRLAVLAKQSLKGKKQLHKKMQQFSPLFRYLTKVKGMAFLEEICLYGNHFAERSLDNKAMSQGY